MLEKLIRFNELDVLLDEAQFIKESNEKYCLWITIQKKRFLKKYCQSNSGEKDIILLNEGETENQKNLYKILAAVIYHCRFNTGEAIHLFKNYGKDFANQPQTDLSRAWPGWLMKIDLWVKKTSYAHTDLE